MIVEIDSNTKVVVKFRHRYFMRLNSPYSTGHGGSGSDPNWVELSGRANYCKAVAHAGDNMSAFIYKVNGHQPLFVTRGTVCTMKFLNRSNEPGAVWYTQPEDRFSALVVCAWDPKKCKHEPFIKWKGRRESLAKALRLIPCTLAVRCHEKGLLDMVCPEPPVKIKQRAHEPHAEVSGDMRTAHSV